MVVVVVICCVVADGCARVDGCLSAVCLQGLV